MILEFGKIKKTKKIVASLIINWKFKYNTIFVILADQRIKFSHTRVIQYIFKANTYILILILVIKNSNTLLQRKSEYLVLNLNNNSSIRNSLSKKCIEQNCLIKD